MELLSEDVRSILANIKATSRKIRELERATGLERLNRIHSIWLSLDESRASVGRGGPEDARVAQLLNDASAAGDLIRGIEDRLAAKIAAEWSTEDEKYVLSPEERAPL